MENLPQSQSRICVNEAEVLVTSMLSLKGGIVTVTALANPFFFFKLSCTDPEIPSLDLTSFSRTFFLTYLLFIFFKQAQQPVPVLKTKAEGH